MKFRILHFFCGIGGSGLGASAADARFGDASATFETIGGIDFDALACKDFERLVGAPALCVDVHELEPEQLRRFAGPIAPDVVMMSPPCKGFSGLLSAKRAAEPKYQRMNTLMLRSLFLVSQTWETPPKLIFVENVPRIASRGQDMVRQCVGMLEAAGMAVALGTHDCGELGGLAQHRRRWFMLARHRATIPQCVYQPTIHRVRACGEVLGPLPIPGDVASAGAMHSVPRLSWRNWVRLALIPAGGDWRDLPGVLVDGEKKREKFRRAPVTPWDAAAETVTGPGGSASTAVADPRFGNVDRVTDWEEPVGTITRSPAPSSGGGAVADPRTRDWFHNVYRVNAWDQPAGTVTGAPKPSSGSIVVADPRFSFGCDCGHGTAEHQWGDRECMSCSCMAFAAKPMRNDDLGVLAWSEPASTISGQARPRNGRFSVADPRFAEGKKKNWQQVAGVTPWTEPAPTVTGGAKIHTGAFQVADPRVNCAPRAGAYRVLSWEEAAATITGSLAIDNGAAAVADPRLVPDRPPPFIPIIVSADGTWHRPLTTLELAALQGFPVTIDGEPLVLAGTSHTRWREAIGNAVPPPAAHGVGEQLLRALLVAALGAFVLDNNPIWVAPQRKALVV